MRSPSGMITATLSALALIGCSPPTGETKLPTGVKTVEVPSDSILGEYVVVQIDGAPPLINIDGYQPMITIGPQRIHFQSQCIFADWEWSRTGDVIEAEPRHDPGFAMCERGLAPGEIAIQDAFASLEQIERETAGALIVTGSGHRLELQRAPSLPAIASLVGEWRVAGIDGQSLDEPHGIALSANEEEIWWAPRCAGMIYSYKIDDTDFATGPRTSQPPADTRTPPPVCTIGLPPRLIDVTRVLDQAERIGRTPENGVRISGGGRSLTLFSQ
ncbi:MAG: hypothetical protein P1U62_13700 [Alteraurantiacibacter sp. bin_em_oilr2.035]|nr:hypothetical protein [Aurantiacibacter atlanticus]MDF1835918.1 hypothetical protein [Alteraurantiacibacter sp. bin_em_oilr2.035]